MQTGIVITDFDDIQAIVEAAERTAWNTHHYVNAENVTITGLKFIPYATSGSSWKTLEVVKNNFTMKYCIVTGEHPTTGNWDAALYFAGTTIQTLLVEDSKFEMGGIHITNGCGTVSNNMQILNNTFMDKSSVSVEGEIVGCGWMQNKTDIPTLTGNNFQSTHHSVVRERGVLINQFDFGNVLANNTFSNAVLLKNNNGQIKEVSAIYFGQWPYTLRRISGKIQIQIDDAASGDVIEVCAGNYTENVTVNKAVEVRGPNHTVAYNGSRAAEAVIDGNILISSSDATFSGFEINRSHLPAANWLMQVTGTSTTVSNNIIKIGTVQSSTVSGFIRLDAPGAVTFSGNELRMATPGSFPVNTGINGLLTQGSGTYTITGNRFAVSGGPTQDADAVGITGGTVVFNGNLVNGDIMGGVTAYGNVGNTQITNNTISGYTTQLAGIRVIDCCGYNSANAEVTITGNFVQGASGTKGIIIAAPAGDIVSLSNNSITGNNTAIQHTGAGTLDATCNWWGTTDPVQIAALVSGGVDVSAWLNSNNLVTPTCTNAAGVVVEVLDGATLAFKSGHPTIQAAINAADAGILLMCQQGFMRSNSISQSFLP
jgi:hypothetical protein